jgi:ABC-type sugar transport system ATPase subunit
MRAISKAFPGVVALDRAELTAYFGRVTALMGANGAGKSTLMNILGGIVARDSGEIIVGGQEAALRTPIESLQAGIGFVQQELNSLPTMSISENIFIDAFPLKFGGIDYKECNRRSQVLLQRLGAKLDPSATVGELSVGDRQLVEIARALRRDPKLLIFDEPTSSGRPRFIGAQALLPRIGGAKGSFLGCRSATTLSCPIFATFLAWGWCAATNSGAPRGR